MTNRKRVEEFLRRSRCQVGFNQWFSVLEIAERLEMQPNQVENALSNNRWDYQRKANACYRDCRSCARVTGWRWRLNGEDKAGDGHR